MHINKSADMHINRSADEKALTFTWRDKNVQKQMKNGYCVNPLILYYHMHFYCLLHNYYESEHLTRKNCHQTAIHIFFMV